MDALSENYNAEADVDDGACTCEKINLLEQTRLL